MRNKGEAPRLETLEALLAEKRKHEGYLAKLEERRGGTPEHVFARLRDEYLTKLTDAQVRASAEAESLSGGLTEDEQAVQESEKKLAALHEEKVEGELRAAVGEFDSKDWQKKLTSLNAAISVAEKDRDALLSVYQRTRDLLAEARGDEAPPPPEPAAPPEAKTRPTTAIAGGPNFDELAFLNSVVGRTSTPGASAAPPARGSQPVRASQLPLTESPSAKPIKEGPSAKPIRESPSAKPISESSSGPNKLSSAAPKAASRAEPTAPEPENQESPAERAAPAVPPSPAPAPELFSDARTQSDSDRAADEDEEEPSGPLGRPTPRTSQAIKTLKCQECGSMNYPTEWYCERCGGELAAL